MSPARAISDFSFDPILHHIFNFLPLRDVCNAALVSSRWHELVWLGRTRLDFEAEDLYPTLPQLVRLLCALMPNGANTKLDKCVGSSRWWHDAQT